MNAVTAELEKRLLELDAISATKLEQVVRDLIEFSRAERGEPATAVHGWPVGYFEETAGCFEGDPLEAPDDPPPAPLDEW